MHPGSCSGSQRWIIHEANLALQQQLAARLQVPKSFAQCLINRGYPDHAAATKFLEPKLAQLSDPYLLPGMEAAVDRLVRARSSGEPLVIFGDYDVDGVTSTAILTEFFAAFGWTASYYLPHRRDEGYGLSPEAVENCLTKFNVGLLLAVDCGSSSAEVIQKLAGRGVDVIILDHHQLGVPEPTPCAFVNPQLLPTNSGNADAAGFKNFCSAGLAFKLAHALLKRGRLDGWEGAEQFDLKPLLDLVALGTIADIVSLSGENRIFARYGLERLETSPRTGIQALKRAAHISGKVRGYTVGFQLGPRLNAAGRLETALDALELLLTRDESKAAVLASRLDMQNRERQEIEQKMVDEAVAKVRGNFDPARDYCIVEGAAHWHIGVVGIVASRILREFHRPVIILGNDGTETLRGSGRSIAGFDLAEALRACGEHLLKHGGHGMAAGISILQHKVGAFRDQFNSIAREKLTPEMLQPVLTIDAEVQLRDLTFDFFRLLERMEPTGLGNVPAQFIARNLQLHGELKPFGQESQHLKFQVTDGAMRHYALWWNYPGEMQIRGRFDLAFIPEMREFNGSYGLQLRVLDLRPA